MCMIIHKPLRTVLLYGTQRAWIKVFGLHTGVVVGRDGHEFGLDLVADLEAVMALFVRVRALSAS